MDAHSFISEMCNMHGQHLRVPQGRLMLPAAGETAPSPMWPVCKGRPGYVISAPVRVLPLSGSNVLNYLDTRLARKGKEEMICGELGKS